MNHRQRTHWQFVAWEIVASVLIGLFAVPAYATPNTEINYQGKLTNASNVAVANGTYTVRFRIYDATSGGTKYFDETHSVTVSNGLFSVMLGSAGSSTVDVDWSQSALYLGVEVDSDGEMLPRKRLGSVPSAHYALDSAKLGGLVKEDFIATSTYSLPNVGSVGSSSATTTFAGFIDVGRIKIGALSGLLKQVNGIVTTAEVGVDYLTDSFREWRMVGGYLTPTSTVPISLTSTTASQLSYASTTALSASTLFSSLASTTNFTISSIATDSLLKTTAGGSVIAALAGTDYLTSASLSGYVPYTGASSAVNLGAQTLTTTGLTTLNGLISTNSTSTYATSTNFFSSNLLSLFASSTYLHADHVGIATNPSPTMELNVAGDIQTTQTVNVGTILNVDGDSVLGNADTDATTIRGTLNISDSLLKISNAYGSANQIITRDASGSTISYSSNLALPGHATTTGVLASYKYVTTPYFIATSTISSVFPYASTTAITASTFYLGNLDGPLQANGGLISATTSVGELYGGTGQTSYTTGDILYANAANSLTKLPIGSAGQVLKVSGGVPSWGLDQTAVGGAGGTWSTTTSQVSGQDINYPNNSSDIVVIGGTATSGAPYWFDPNALRSYFSGNVGIGTTSPGAMLSVQGKGLFSNNVNASFFVASSTTASIFPYASTTALTVSGTAYIGSLTGSLQAINGVVSASSTLSVAYGGTGATTFTSKGILYGNGAGAIQATAAGTNGYVLATVGGTPTWVATTTLANISGTLSLASGGTSKALTAVAGGMVYSDADSLEITAAGTAGQILMSGGTGAPMWVSTSTIPFVSTSLASAKIIVGNGSGIATAVDMSSDATISNTGAVTVADDSHNHVITNIDAFTSLQLATQLSDETGTGLATFSFDPTIIRPTFGNGITLGTSSAATFVITSALSGATDPTLTFGNDLITSSGDFKITGDNLYMNTNTSGAILVANGTSFAPVVMGGDASVATNGTVTLASGITRDTEWDTWLELPALTSAHILVGNVSNQAVDVAMTGDVSITNAGVTAVADDSHNHVITNIDAFTSLQLATQLSDETGTGLATFSFDPTIIRPTFGNGITLGTSSAATFVITSALSGATDPTLTFGNDLITSSGDFKITGDNLYMNTNTSGAILVANGTSFAPVVMGGDASVATNGTVTLASGITRDTEWDTWLELPALTSAHILVGNVSNQAVDVAMTGDVTITNAGVTAVADDSHNHVITNIDAFTSLQLATQLSDETGTGLATFSFDPTIIRPTFGNGITLGTSSAATFVITSALSGATDPTLTFGNDLITSSGDFKITGDNLYMNTNTSGAILVANGTSFAPVVMGGDASVATNGTVTLASGITRDTEWDTWLELPALTSAHILVGNVSNQAVDVAMTGDVTITNAGVTAIGANKVTGAMIALGSDATGDLMYYNGTNWARLAVGTNGNILSASGGLPKWIATSTMSAAGTTLAKGNFLVGSDEGVAQATSTIFISSTGNVGIGTLEPNNLLQVADLIDFNDASFSTKIGYQAGKNIFPGADYNTFVGHEAGLSNETLSTSGAGTNSAFGYRALYSNTTGYSNTAIGSGSLYLNTTGYNNIALGNDAGKYTSGGSDNAAANNSIYLGYDTRTLTFGGATNEIVIGASAIGLGSNTVVLGNESIVTTALRGKVGIGTTSPSSLFSVHGSGYISSNLFVGGNIVSTSTSSSILPYASTTALTSATFYSSLASTTNLNISSIASGSLLKTTTDGSVIAATADSDYQVPLTFGDGLTRTLNDIDCDTASGSVFGCLTSANWTTFNNKLSSALTKGYFLVGSDEGTAQATSTIFIDSVGKVGIGTTTPQSLFHMYDTGYTHLDIDSGATASDIYFREGGTTKWRTGYDIAQNKFFIRDNYNGSTVVSIEDAAPQASLYIDSTGTFGIGATTSPWAQLSVSHYSAGASTMPLFVVASSTGAGATSTPFIIDSIGNVGIGTTSPYAALSVVGSTGVVADKYFATSTTATSTFAGGLTVDGTTLVVDYSTNSVGVGKSTPDATLDVYGTANFNSTATNLPGFVVTTPYAGWDGGNLGAVQFDLSGATTYGRGFNIKYNSAATPLTNVFTIANESNVAGLRYYSTGNFAVDASTLYVDAADNQVGIGNTSPSYTLDVAGFINTDQYSGYKQAGDTILSASSTTGNLFAGISAGSSMVTAGALNTAFGTYALASATSTDYNTAIGYGSMRYASSTAALGHANVGIGINSLYGNTGNYNIGIGYKALAGYGVDAAPLVPMTGSSNVAIGGYYTMTNNISGNYNIGIGDSALQLNQSSHYSTAIGWGALRYSTTNANTAVGFGAGVREGSRDYRSVIDTTMVFLGNYASRDSSVASTTALSNGIAIGYDAKVLASNQAVLGNDSITTTLLKGNVGIGTTSPFAKLSINPVAGDGHSFVIGSSTATRFVVNNAGNVGIGTTNPSSKLEISGNTGTNAGSAINQITLTGSYVNKGRLANNWDGTYLMNNVYFDGASYLRDEASSAQMIALDNWTDAGAIRFRTGGTSGIPPERMTITNEGKVGIGTTTPLMNLDVYAASSTGYVARVFNSNTGTTADGLLVQIGQTGYGTTGNIFVGFADSTATGVPTLAGRIIGDGAGGVTYETSGADFSEYFHISNPSEKPEKGELVTLVEGKTETVSRAMPGSSPIGIVATSPGFVGNAPMCEVDDLNCEGNEDQYNVIVAMAGRVPTKVNMDGGAIKPGDRITLSTMSGVGAKATTSGVVVGIALDTFDSSSKKDGNGVGTIKVLVNLSYYKIASEIKAGEILASLWTLDEDTGSIRALGPVDFNNFPILNVKAIQSYSGTWSIDENGAIVAEDLKVKNSATIGTSENRIGVTLFDEISGEPYCLRVSNGSVKATFGECGASSSSSSDSSSSSSTSDQSSSDTGGSSGDSTIPSDTASSTSSTESSSDSTAVPESTTSSTEGTPATSEPTSTSEPTPEPASDSSSEPAAESTPSSDTPTP